MRNSIDLYGDERGKYEEFLEMFKECGTAHVASAAVFPGLSWQAIYKRIKNDPDFYRRYREIAADVGGPLVRSRVSVSIDPFNRLCRLIESGSPVYLAIREVYPDKRVRSVIKEIESDKFRSDAFYESRRKRKVLVKLRDRINQRKRSSAYWRNLIKDPVKLARRRELGRENRKRQRQSEAWRLRQKLLGEISKEAKATGLSTKEIHKIWKVPTMDEWRKSFVDYSAHNIQE